MKNENLKKTTFRIPSDVLEQAKICAVEEGLSLNKYVLSSLISAIFSSKQSIAKKKTKIRKTKNINDAYIRR